MDPPCTIVAKTVLPQVKKGLAKKYADRGLSQGEISTKLGVSQTMISKYLADERKEEGGLGEEIDGLIEELWRLMEIGSSKEEQVLNICSTCFRIREAGDLCESCGIENCNVCSQLRYGDLTEDKRQVLKDIKDALVLLERADISALEPQVRINLAQASRDASSKMDVASIPGRLINIKGRMRSNLPPEFGTSKHLSQVLLGIKNPLVRAVMNIKFDENIEKSLKKLKFKSIEFDRKKGELLDLVRTIDDQEIIIDRGDFGIEPCTYILGHNALDVVNKAETLAREINGKRT